MLVQATDYYPFGKSFEHVNVAQNRYLYNGKELQDQAIGGTPFGWYDYGARFYDPEIGRFHTNDPLAFKFFDLTPYGYAANNPIKLIDIGGLAPGNIVSSNGGLTRAFIHLMALSTGVSEETLWKTSIIFSDKFHDKVTGYKSGGITIHDKIIFTEDFDGDNYPSDVSTWFSILPHELGHRVQSNDKSLYLTSYIVQSIVTAIKEGSIDANKIHDKIPMEVEATYIQQKFNKFYNAMYYTDIYGKRRNKLTDLFSYGIKDQDYLIFEIDKLWKEYQGQQEEQSQEDKEKNKQAMNDAKNLPAGAYKWNGSKWVKK